MAENKPHEKVERKSNFKFSFKKSITKIKLDHANIGKIKGLDATATEFMGLVQKYCDQLIELDAKTPDKNSALPKTKTPLSVRWQRCAWRQACGIVQSWFSNERTTPPILSAVSIQADTNVAELKPSGVKSFDFWVKLATLEKGHPVLLPVKLYPKASQTLKKYPCLFTGLRLEKVDDEWYLTLVVGKESKKGEASGVVGVDIGMKSMVVTSEGVFAGEISDKIRTRVEKSKEKFARKQKLNACLKKKGKQPVGLTDKRVESHVRNEAGRAINRMIRSLLANSAVAVERLNVKDMRFKSREMNRWLRASQLGFIHDRLKFKLDDAGIRYRSVQLAYSSQQCSACGYVDAVNRAD